jgi:hypothetical protein
MLDLHDPRRFGLTKPAYGVADPEVKSAVGSATKVYQEIAAKTLRAFKDGKRTKISAPSLVDYLLTLQQQTSGLGRSPNPAARKRRAAS